MYNLIRDDPQYELLRDRLARLLTEIRALKLSTREEYQAEVFSRVNGVLARGNHMLPLFPVPAEGPAIVGHVAENFARLNQDATDIASQLLRVEASVAQLYNLAAASQNTLRQQIRESLYASSSRRFCEAFVHDRNLAGHSATIDFDAAAASLPLVDEVEVVPAIAVGPNSVGEVVTPPAALSDGDIETAFVFDGTRVELILTFEKPEIINRLRLELDDYQGLEITTLTSSPDGSVFEDVLADLGTRTLLLNSVAGKYSGDIVLDFPPRHAKQMRLVIEDRVETARIALRSLTAVRRRYEAQGELVTKPVTLTPSVDPYLFSTRELVSDPFTTITHQISTDGVHFTNITPGDVTTTSPFWYRAVLQRGANAFTEQSSALLGVGDLRQTDTYTLRRMATVPLGAGVLERTIQLENVSGPVQFRDVPLPNTFKVQEGSVYLTAAEYTFANGFLAFSGQKPLVTVSYQTSALGAAALAARKDFYTPLLYEARFEVL